MSKKPRSKTRVISLLATGADDFYNSLVRSRPSSVPPGSGDRALSYLVCSLIMTDREPPYWNNAQLYLEKQVAEGGGQ